MADQCRRSCRRQRGSRPAALRAKGHQLVSRSGFQGSTERRQQPWAPRLAQRPEPLDGGHGLRIEPHDPAVHGQTSAQSSARRAPVIAASRKATPAAGSSRPAASITARTSAAVIAERGATVRRPSLACATTFVVTISSAPLGTARPGAPSAGCGSTTRRHPGSEPGAPAVDVGHGEPPEQSPSDAIGLHQRDPDSSGRAPLTRPQVGERVSSHASRASATVRPAGHRRRHRELGRDPLRLALGAVHRPAHLGRATSVVVADEDAHLPPDGPESPIQAGALPSPCAGSGSCPRRSGWSGPAVRLVPDSAAEQGELSICC